MKIDPDADKAFLERYGDLLKSLFKLDDLTESQKRKRRRTHEERKIN